MLSGVFRPRTFGSIKFPKQEKKTNKRPKKQQTSRPAWIHICWRDLNIYIYIFFYKKKLKMGKYLKLGVVIRCPGSAYQSDIWCNRRIPSSGDNTHTARCCKCPLHFANCRLRPSVSECLCFYLLIHTMWQRVKRSPRIESHPKPSRIQSGNSWTNLLLSYFWPSHKQNRASTQDCHAACPQDKQQHKHQKESVWFVLWIERKNTLME